MQEAFSIAWPVLLTEFVMLLETVFKYCFNRLVILQLLPKQYRQTVVIRTLVVLFWAVPSTHTVYFWPSKKRVSRPRPLRFCLPFRFLTQFVVFKILFYNTT